MRDDARVPLDEFLPGYDVNEVHSTRIAAPPEAVIAAVRALTPREVRLVGALMAVRTLPAMVRRRRLRTGHRGLDELVLGAIGRFWTADGGILRVSGDEFVTFCEPGFAKAVVNFHVRESGTGTLLTTETRIRGTDEDARRRFRRYWRIVMPGSALIRRAWLRAIRKRAEAPS